MSNTVTLEWKPFMNGNIIPKQSSTKANRAIQLAATVAITPVSSNDTWNNVFNTALNISDYLCMGVIIFAGATWMFSNRTKALEMLIGGASGYLIIRHAHDIQSWLAHL